MIERLSDSAIPMTRLPCYLALAQGEWRVILSLSDQSLNMSLNVERERKMAKSEAHIMGSMGHRTRIK